MSTLSYLVELVNKLTNSDLDRFEILQEATKFHLKLEEEESKSYEQLRNLLLIEVLQESLKLLNYSEDLYKKYKNLSETTKKSLIELDPSIKFKDYCCMIPGCLFKCSRHRLYITHLQRVHSSSGNFQCNFKQDCLRVFSTIEDLKDHVKEDHTSKKELSHGLVSLQNQPSDPVISFPCKCSMVRCGQQGFSSLRELATHMNIFHKGEFRPCIFEGCQHKFNPGQESRKHFRNKHFDIGKTALKAGFVIPLGHSSLVVDNSDIQVHVDEEIESDENLEEIRRDNNNETEEEDVEDPDKSDSARHFLMAYADFINRMINVDCIPSKTANKLANEYFCQMKESSKTKEAEIRAVLSKVNGIDQTAMEDVVKSCLKDPFLEAQETLDTEHKRKSFIEDNFNYIKPKEIILNKEEHEAGHPKECIHYIPIVQAFKVLVEDSSFQKALQTADSDEENKIKDVKDGAVYKNSDFFKDNPQALTIMMYSDGVEVTSPISYGKGKHKLVQLYWQIADVPKFQRSGINRLQLGMVFKEKLLKKYSQKVIYESLINDLKELEHGILVSKPFDRVVKAGLLLYSGDNLESHLVGGFSANFSSKDICRHCHIQHGSLNEMKIHDYDAGGCLKRWNEEEYDEVFVNNSSSQDEIQGDAVSYESDMQRFLFNQFQEPEEDAEEDDEDPNEKKPFGLKEECPFNVLQSFHCVRSMPPDLMHDLMEGVIPQDLLGIIRIFVKLKWFTMEEYNKALSHFKFSPEEASSKPQNVPEKNEVKKLRGKAISHWIHLRNFPLIMALNNWIKDDTEIAWKLILVLHELTERITSDAFNLYEIEVLDEIIIDYLDLRKEVFQNHPTIGKFKPKHHYLAHYREAILKFGPPTCYWTARYESKHRQAKSTVEAAKNFINISHTVSERMQFRIASIYYHGMYNTRNLVYPKEVKTKQEMLSAKGTDKFIGVLMAEGDLICKKVEYKNRKYETGNVVVLDRKDLLSFDVGLIKAVLVRKQQVFLIIHRFEVSLKVGYFESGHSSRHLEKIDVCSLQDAYPLFKRGSDSSFILVLHHHISFKYA